MWLAFLSPFRELGLLMVCQDHRLEGPTGFCQTSYVHPINFSPCLHDLQILVDSLTLLITDCTKIFREVSKMTITSQIPPRALLCRTFSIVCKDPQSLDAAVQNTLSGLFPPFEATAPTVLSQLFRVLESKYHGDGLCCLLDFLIPLKRLLEHIRQAACAPYSGRVFLHEGWPLCLHEKVTVHLSPLNPLLLRPGDFYLQAEPCGEQSACLVVKCLSKDLTTAEKIPIPDTACSWLFTEAWLEDINRDLERPTLHTCLVATGNGIVPVPWNKIATPEFVQLPKAEHPMEKDSVHLETQGRLNAESPSQPSGGDQVSQTSPAKYPGLIKVDQGSWKKSTLFVVPSLCDIISENLEGEYVNLVDFSEESSNVEPPSPAAVARRLAPEAGKALLLQPDEEIGPHGVAWDCGKGEDLEEGPCTPCLRRKMSPDAKIHEPRCRYRDSYMAALQNPISFNSGLMAAILEEMDLTQAAPSSEEVEAQPDEGSGQMISPCPLEHPDKDRKMEENPRLGVTKPAKSPAEGPAAGSKFSFLKGHRPSASSGEGSSSPEKAGKGPEGLRKKTLMVSSPKAARAKSVAGKGSSPTEMAFGDLSRPLTLDAVGMTPSSTDNLINESLVLGSNPSESVLWDLLNSELLSSGIARLPGSVDKLGRPLVEVPQNGGSWQDPGISAKEVAQLLLCLCSMARKRSSDQAVVILIDGRKEAPPPTLPTALGSLQKSFPGSIQVLLLVAEKEATTQVEKFLGLQVEAVTSSKALIRHVDSSQLTQAFDGHFPYNHGEWVQFFQKVHHFVGGLKKASELLRTTAQELEKEEGLETLQAVERQVSRHRQLMQEVLCDAQLVNLQREGGVTLARMRKEAARLGFTPDVRRSFESTLAIYNLVEEDVHTLVTKSNSCLEHLEFLKKIRELEEEFHQVTLWIDEEGDPELTAVGLVEGSLEKTEESYRRFKDFFKEATVHYNRGLSLSKEAAKIQGFKYPEMSTFEAAKGTFQAKLTMFYMDMEMKGAELETFLDLYRFCDKVTAFHLDCKEHLAQSKSREKEPNTVEAQQDNRDVLRRMSEDFSEEKFQQMKLQASSMHSDKGRLIWSDALERSREAKRMLEDLQVHFKEAKGGVPAGDWAEGRGPSSPNSSSSIPADVFNGGEALETKDPEPFSKETLDRMDGSVDASRSSLCVNSGVGGRGHEEAMGGRGHEAILEFGGLDSQHLGEEPCRRPQRASWDSSPLRRSSASSPKAETMPGTGDTPPITGHSCLPRLARGPPRPQKRERAQYFQLSRHGSFSSEDADSQNSSEDAVDSSSTWSVDLQGLRGGGGGGAQEKGQGILYLENHSPSSGSGLVKPET
ncbi:uncharacterized protein KIAA1755 homolog [Erythrolamprus reginae]|uniref:uncharacterized protein KIAA1755 homolog n=1 Tax=Erythrolamprus reginae TaxID=121349 RepID=UPI00396CF88A